MYVEDERTNSNEGLTACAVAEVEADMQEPTPADSFSEFCANLAKLPADTMLPEEALMKMLNKSRKSIRRSVDRGELPAPVRVMGKRVWTVSSIVQHIQNRLKDKANESRSMRERSK